MRVNIELSMSKMMKMVRIVRSTLELVQIQRKVHWHESFLLNPTRFRIPSQPRVVIVFHYRHSPYLIQTSLHFLRNQNKRSFILSDPNLFIVKQSHQRHNLNHLNSQDHSSTLKLLARQRHATKPLISSTLRISIPSPKYEKETQEKIQHITSHKQMFQYGN